MNNWELLFENGKTLTEQDAQYWDNVPDEVIKRATFVLLNGSKIVFEKFDSICIAKLGMSAVGGESGQIGYRITEVKNNLYNDFMITNAGVKRETNDVSLLTIPAECFRLGSN